jgi:uncharacterized membrane protein
MHRISYKILFLITVIASISGILTLLPTASASYPNVMSYKSFCTFNPAASLFCFLIAGFSCFIRSALIKDQSGSVKERLKKHIHSLIPLVIILILALSSSGWIILEKQKYIDSGSGATEISVNKLIKDN